jgi:mannose-6-phosphate isomerase
LSLVNPSECVECVGCSNNTIRAALTPKYIDVESLCEVLNYRMTDPSYYMVPAETMAEFPHVVEYAPDCKDFTLHQIKVSPFFGCTQATERYFQIPACTTKNPDPYQLPALDCGSIVVLVEGSGQLEECAPPSGGHKRPQKSMAVVRGDIVYIPPNQRLQFDCVTRPILAYRTFSYEDGPDHSNRNLAAPIVPQYSETKMKEEKPVKRPMKTVAARRCIERPRMAIKTSEIGRAEVFDVETEMDGFM